MFRSRYQQVSVGILVLFDHYVHFCLMYMYLHVCAGICTMCALSLCLGTGRLSVLFRFACMWVVCAVWLQHLAKWLHEGKLGWEWMHHRQEPNVACAYSFACMCIVHWMGTLCTERGKVGFEPRILGYQTLSFANCTRHLSPSQTCNSYPIKAKQAHTSTYMQYLYIHAHTFKYLQYMHIHVMQLNALACKKLWNLNGDLGRHT